MSDRENRIRATGFSKITDVPGKDYPAAILLLQKTLGRCQWKCVCETDRDNGDLLLSLYGLEKIM